MAAKRLAHLKDIRFPLVFELTTDDLLFPYNKDAWMRSPRSAESVSVTCILEPDGRLATAESESRFGFAISDPIRPKEKIARTESGGEEEEAFMRTDAKITINMRADGRAYSAEEEALLARVDGELDRLSEQRQ